MSAQPVETRRREAQAWAEGILVSYAIKARNREQERLTQTVIRLAAGRIAKDHCCLCGFPSIGPLCIGHADLAEAITQREKTAA